MTEQKVDGSQFDQKEQYRFLRTAHYGGSNPAWIIEYEGKQFYAKEYRDPDQARCEYVSNQIYKKLGAPVLDGRIVQIGERTLYVTPLITDYRHFRLQYNPDIREFTVNGPSNYYISYYHQKELDTMLIPGCLLLDWDCVGIGDKPLGNLLVVDDQHLVLVDHGGSLLFRGLLGRKPTTALTAEVSELEIFLDTDGINPITAAIFKHISPDAVRNGVLRLETLTVEEIKQIVRSAQFDPSIEDKIISLLVSRRQKLIDKVLGSFYFPDETKPQSEVFFANTFPELKSDPAVSIERIHPMTIEALLDLYGLNEVNFLPEFKKLAKNIFEVCKSQYADKTREIHMLWQIWSATRDKQHLAESYPWLLEIADVLDSDESFIDWLSTQFGNTSSKFDNWFYQALTDRVWDFDSLHLRSHSKFITNTRPDLRWFALGKDAYGVPTVAEETILDLACKYVKDTQIMNIIQNGDRPNRPETNILYHETNSGALPSIANQKAIFSAQRLQEIGIRINAGENLDSRTAPKLNNVYARREDIGIGHGAISWFGRKPVVFTISEIAQAETMKNIGEELGLDPQENSNRVDSLLRRSRAILFPGQGPRSYDNLLGPEVPLRNCTSVWVYSSQIEETQQLLREAAPHIQVYCLEAATLITDFGDKVMNILDGWQKNRNIHADEWSSHR